MTNKYQQAIDKQHIIADQLTEIARQLNEKWEDVKQNPFDLNLLFTLLGKTTMAVNFLLEEKLEETQKSINTLEQLKEIK